MRFLLRFLEDIRRMIGWSGQESWYKAYKIFWAVMWRLVTPLLLLAILVASAADYKPMMYGDYRYPGWANGVGWMVSLISVTCIPIVGVYLVVKTQQHSTSAMRVLLTPAEDWGKIEEQVLKENLA